MKNNTNSRKLPAKILSILYSLTFIVFIAVIIKLDILPITTVVLIGSILAILSLVIVLQLCSNKIKTFAKILASCLSVVLICGFVTTSVYAMQTLSFLSDTSVHNKEKALPVIKEPFNVCITGIDVDGEIDEQGRSDVNMIVTVNPTTGKILLTSIPRDYEIYLSDYNNATDKLTHTGFIDTETTIKAEEDLLGINIDKYVKINFSTVTEFIDAIGGVDVYSDYEFTPVKKKDWTVQKGINHMNGKEALAFARERKAFIDGDIQRTKNQQAVFEALIEKSTSSKNLLLNYSKILSSLKKYFEMSFSSEEIKSLIKYQLVKTPDWEIYKNTLVGGDSTIPTYSTGSTPVYVMSQNQESIDNAKKLINGVMSGDNILKDKDGNLYLESEIINDDTTDEDTQSE